MTASERDALLSKVGAVPGAARERVRAALLELRREGRDVSVRTVRERAGGNRAAVGFLVAAQRAGLLDLESSWERLDVAPTAGSAGPASAGAASSARRSGRTSTASTAETSPEVEGLLAMIDAATTPAKVADVARLVSRLVAARKLEVAAGRLLLEGCKEQRQGLAAAGARPGASLPETVHVLTAEAVAIAQAVEGLCDPDARARVAALVAELAAAQALDPRWALDATGSTADVA